MTPQERIAMWGELITSDGWKELREDLSRTIAGAIDNLERNCRPDDAVGISANRAKLELARKYISYPETQYDIAYREMNERTEETEVS